MPVVVDASALVELLLNTPRGTATAQAVDDSPMASPDLVNVEVASSLRGLEAAGKLDPSRARQALADLSIAPVRRMPTLPLISDVWALRQNVSAYDAFYVALARALDCPLVTADRRLAGAPGLRVPTIAV